MIDQFKSDFPILSRRVRNDKPLVYLDNAATTQKPQAVIDALVNYYTVHNANIHRGVHALAEESTEMHEAVRKQVQDFLHARLPSEIIFTSGTTEAVNLVAYSWGRENVTEGDEILLTQMEHHANLVPWQVLAKEKGATLRFLPVTDEGVLDTRNLKGYLTEKTKFVSLVHASNFLGTLNDLEPIIKRAKNLGVPVLVDAAQSAPHMQLNVQKMGCDFLVLSAHKMLGPTGVGVLYAKKETMEGMPPFITGGSMISRVTFEESTFQDVPHRYEAGTPNIAGVIGFGAALTYLKEVFENNDVLAHEQELVEYTLEMFKKVGGVEVYGPQNTQERVGVVSFSVDGIHSHDMATIADEQGVAIRSGHHCVQPMHDALGIKDSARASFYLYNTREDVDALVESIHAARKIFSI